MRSRSSGCRGSITRPRPRASTSTTSVMPNPRSRMPSRRTSSTPRWQSGSSASTTASSVSRRRTWRSGSAAASTDWCAARWLRSSTAATWRGIWSSDAPPRAWFGVAVLSASSVPPVGKVLLAPVLNGAGSLINRGDWRRSSAIRGSGVLAAMGRLPETSSVASTEARCASSVVAKQGCGPLRRGLEAAPTGSLLVRQGGA